MNKKKIRTTAAAVALAAVVALGGGSLAYFTWTSDEIDNVAANNYNWVSLTETLVDEEGKEMTIGGSDATSDPDINDTYEIIPGTSQDKDPLVTVSYSLDSYVFVEVTDTSGGLISWDPAAGWALLEGTAEYDDDNNLTYAVYYRLVTTEDEVDDENKGNASGVAYYVQKFSVLDDSISYSSAIGNGDVVEVSSDGTPTFTNTDIRLTFQAYIMQADIAGISTGDNASNESALACWNAMNASSDTSTVTAGNAEVTTDDNTKVTTTEGTIVVTSDDEAYTATVPAGVVIDTDTAEIVETTNDDGNTTTTTTLILVVDVVGDDYTTEGIAVSAEIDETATVYDIYIIGVDDSNTTVMEIALDIGTGVDVTDVEHKGDSLKALDGRQKFNENTTEYSGDSYYYDSESGILYIYTSTFSEFAVYTVDSSKSVVDASDSSNTYTSLSAAADAGMVATIYSEESNGYLVYSTLADAVSAAGSGDTVALISDCEDMLTVTSDLTLDLAGHSMTGKDTRITITSGTLTLTDSSGNGNYGAVECTATGSNTKYGILLNGGKVVVNNVTVSGPTGICPRNGEVVVNSGKVVGTMNTTAGGIFVQCHNNTYKSFMGTVSITINGGEITGDLYGLYVSDQLKDYGNFTVTLNGGTISSKITSSYGMYIAGSYNDVNLEIPSDSTVVVSGVRYGA